MAVDDLWYLTKRGPNNERLPSKRHGRGKRWRVRWIDDAGQSKQRLYEKKTDAERWDANVHADLSRGLYIDPDAGKVTVREYADQWRSTRLHRDSTVERVERAFRLHVNPILGGRQIAQVRTSHVQAWVKDRARVLEPSTLRIVYSYVQSMFASAQIDRAIGVSPCRGVQLPDIVTSELVVPTADQVYALADALDGRTHTARYAALPILAAGSGLRQGEAWGLEVEHVDFLRRRIRVVQQLKVMSDGARFAASISGRSRLCPCVPRPTWPRVRHTARPPQSPTPGGRRPSPRPPQRPRRSASRC